MQSIQLDDAIARARDAVEIYEGAINNALQALMNTHTADDAASCYHASVALLAAYRLAQRQISDATDALRAAINASVKEMAAGAQITKYHVFTDGYDAWFDDYRDAVRAYLELTSWNKRLYLEEYDTPDDYENDVMIREDCVLAQGDFPA